MEPFRPDEIAFQVARNGSEARGQGRAILARLARDNPTVCSNSSRG
jgi:hypothetical protein